MSTIKSSFIAFSILVTLAIFGPVGIIATFWGTSTVKAAQPRSATIAYITEDFRVWCESPSGDKIYVSKVGPSASGVHLVVISGGCK